MLIDSIDNAGSRCPGPAGTKDMIVRFGQLIDQFAATFGPQWRGAAFVNKKCVRAISKMLIKQGLLIAITFPVGEY
jgi:hypothetical protein